jgi:Domain of unknown function (DUF4112)
VILTWVLSGPWGLGLDGILSWIPGVGEAYSVIAAAYLLIQGARARVPLATLLTAAALMGGRTLVTAIPLIGPLAADALTLHKWSARLIVRAIDKRIAADGGGRENFSFSRSAPAPGFR